MGAQGTEKTKRTSWLQAGRPAEKTASGVRATDSKARRGNKPAPPAGVARLQPASQENSPGPRRRQARVKDARWPRPQGRVNNQDNKVSLGAVSGDSKVSKPKAEVKVKARAKVKGRARVRGKARVRLQRASRERGGSRLRAGRAGSSRNPGEGAAAEGPGGAG